MLYGCLACAIRRLQCIHNYTVHVVTQLQRDLHHHNRCCSQYTGWQYSSDWFTKQHLSCIQSYHCTSTPAYVDELLTAPTHCSFTRPLLTAHYTQTTLLLCRIWNSLTTDVQSGPSQAAVKRRLKTQLFDVTFTEQPGQ